MITFLHLIKIGFVTLNYYIKEIILDLETF